MTSYLNTSLLHQKKCKTMSSTIYIQLLFSYKVFLVCYRSILPTRILLMLSCSSEDLQYLSAQINDRFYKV